MPELAVRFRSLLEECAEQLRRAGIPEPRREALRLWSELSGARMADAPVGEGLPVPESRASELRRAVGRRARGEPFPYVTGVVGFRHLSLRIDRRALIPRPETEGLVELLIQRARGGVVADIGTGSGCIALSLAQEGEFGRVVGIDCSSDALALAMENVHDLGGKVPVDLIRADLCRPLRPASCHALISNPPYLTGMEYARLDPSVRNWEPAVALESGSDGLETTGRLIREGRAALEPGGWLALEVDCSRALAAAHMASRYGWEHVSIHKDLFGRERYVLARRSMNGDLG